MTEYTVPNGYVLYDGPSQLDPSQRIVCIITATARPSANRKTGDFMQTWILSAEQSPVAALTTGADAAVCGQCVHRPAVRRAARASGSDPAAPCYVNVGQAPASIWKAWTRGAYPTLPTGTGPLRNVPVRLGAYGDPAAVPVAVLQTAVALGSGKWTGYTHQWQTAGLQSLCMASADSPEERTAAERAGYRVFRVTPVGAHPEIGETTCPASAEAGNRTTCARCTLCNGSRGADDRRRSITINAH